MLTIGIIGAGMMGRVHADAWTRIKDARLVGIADEKEEAAAKLSSQYGVKAYASMEELIQTEKPDIVDICLPNDLHKEYVVRAAEQGIHVFCEKPIASTLEDAREMTESCRAAGVKLMIGHALRFSPDYAMAKRLVEEGRLGKVGTVRMIREGAAPGWADWFKDKRRSGGVLADLGIHDLDWLRWTFGEPERVYAKVAEKGLPGSHAFVSIRMKSGVIAHLTASWALPEGFRSFLELAGTGGVATIDSDQIKPISVWSRQPESGGVATESPLGVSPYQAELQHFVDCVRSGAEPLVGGEEAMKSLTLALAAARSADTGEVVTFEGEGGGESL